MFKINQFNLRESMEFDKTGVKLDSIIIGKSITSDDTRNKTNSIALNNNSV